MRILIVALLALAGCVPTQKLDVDKPISVDISGRYYEIRKIEFEEHRYLLFDGYGQVGIAHDPSCPCER